MDAAAYLKARGWRGEGHALHSSGRGLTRPLLVSKKTDLLGVGKKKTLVADQWWMRAFDESLKTLGSGQQTTLSSVREKGIRNGGLYGFFVKGEELQGTITPDESAAVLSENTSANMSPVVNGAASDKELKRNKKRKREKEVADTADAANTVEEHAEEASGKKKKKSKKHIHNDEKQDEIVEPKDEPNGAAKEGKKHKHKEQKQAADSQDDTSTDNKEAKKHKKHKHKDERRSDVEAPAEGAGVDKKEEKKHKKHKHKRDQDDSGKENQDPVTAKTPAEPKAADDSQFTRKAEKEKAKAERRAARKEKEALRKKEEAEAIAAYEAEKAVAKAAEAAAIKATEDFAQQTGKVTLDSERKEVIEKTASKYQPVTVNEEKEQEREKKKRLQKERKAAMRERRKPTTEEMAAHVLANPELYSIDAFTKVYNKAQTDAKEPPMPSDHKRRRFGERAAAKGMSLEDYLFNRENKKEDKAQKLALMAELEAEEAPKKAAKRAKRIAKERAKKGLPPLPDLEAPIEAFQKHSEAKLVWSTFDPEKPESAQPAQPSAEEGDNSAQPSSEGDNGNIHPDRELNFVIDTTGDANIAKKLQAAQNETEQPAEKKEPLTWHPDMLGDRKVKQLSKEERKARLEWMRERRKERVRAKGKKPGMTPKERKAHKYQRKIAKQNRYVFEIMKETGKPKEEVTKEELANVRRKARKILREEKRIKRNKVIHRKRWAEEAAKKEAEEKAKAAAAGES